MPDDIVDTLREEGFITHMARLSRESKILHDAADEIERLREALRVEQEELAACCIDRRETQRERDEARREILESLHPDLRKSYAAARGWDCCKENTNV